MSEELQRKLKAAREKAGLSQSKAAKEWEIPLKTLQAWEQDQRTPKGFALKAINEKLDRILSEE